MDQDIKRLRRENWLKHKKEVEEQIVDQTLRTMPCGSPAGVSQKGPTHRCHAEQEVPIITWNVDGLDTRSMQVRLLHMVHVIKQHKPAVVMLQEIVDRSFRFITKHLARMYHVVGPESCERVSIGEEKVEYDTSSHHGYYNVLLISKFHFELRACYIYYFPTSEMGRHLIYVHANIIDLDNHRVIIGTSHLESMAPNARERKHQLLVSQELLVRACERHKSSIGVFGGDTNLRDQEQDSLEASGSLVMEDIYKSTRVSCLTECDYTWDSHINVNCMKGRSGHCYKKSRNRFDRLYLYERAVSHNIDSASPAKPESSSRTPNLDIQLEMELVGQEYLPDISMFASDHWGVRVTMNLKLREDTIF